MYKKSLIKNYLNKNIILKMLAFYGYSYYNLNIIIITIFI